jgi:gluconolactonase
MQTKELSDVEVIAEGLEFPEGPVVMDDGTLVVVELSGGRLTRVLSDGTTDTIADLGGGPNGAAVGPDGALYVCNNGGIGATAYIGGRVQRVDPSTGEFETLYAECDGVALTAPNDLVFDHTGNFYFTDFLHDGGIFYASPDGSSIERVVKRCASPNGIGLSPDGSVLYWAETHTRQVQRRRVESPGQLQPTPGYTIRALVFNGAVDEFALLAGLPGNYELDSLAVDSAGAVCVGTLVDAGLSEITEDGEWTLHTLPEALADGAVTNVCFGGDDLTTAYITCSLTGRLVRSTWHRPGLKLAF